MSSSCANAWNWEWPSVGPSPVHHGLDSEVFDRTDFPYTDTFVREAIQNSLDARLYQNEPVTISFHFHSNSTGPRRAFLDKLIEHRNTLNLEVPDEWKRDELRWLIVEDFNSTGLSGSLESRKSNFWGYWLNFGVTNKQGTGRGAHGIGRVTFLIASQIQSVIGYTRRDEDGKTAACGMAILRAEEIYGELKSTHAYLAEGTSGNIYQLYDSPEFQDQLQEAFSFNGYCGKYRSGLGLAILYPHDDLKRDVILAAAIEHFSPAIIENDLVVEVDRRTLDSSSIDEIARDRKIVDSFHDAAIKEDATNYLNLVRTAVGSERTVYTVNLPNPTRKCLKQWGKENTGKIESICERMKVSPVILDIVFPLRYKGETDSVFLRSVVSECTSGRKPLDLFFRRGMCLPHVKEKNTRELNIVISVPEEGWLAMYLNFCEGKAHLDLHNSKEVRQKLKEKGFDDGISVRHLVKPLSADLRELLLPNLSEPDPRVFEQYFSKPLKNKPGVGTVNPRPPITPKSTPEFEITKLKDNGVCIRAKSEFNEWPVNAVITLAYADGSNRPSWSPHDFMLENLRISSKGCESQISDNMVRATKCSKDTKISISDFDRNREVHVMIKREKIDNA